MNTSTSLKSAIAFAAAMLVAGAVHAHDCSGGAGGGMDATGNDCGGVADVAFAGDPVAAAAARGSTAATARKAAPPIVAMNRTGHASHHAHVRHASGAKSRSQV